MYRHLELADFIIYSYSGIDRTNYFPSFPDKFIKFLKIRDYYSIPKHIEIVEEFFG